MSAEDLVTIRRILKVNHAGEYGAIRIYRAQLAAARLFFPDLHPFFCTTLAHETEHCQRFRAAMPSRLARPCRVMFLWSWGGYLLGALSSMLGTKGMMICTAAVESTVHRHLEEQLRFLASKDDALAELIREIQKEELQHLGFAQARLAGEAGFSLFEKLVIGTTEIVIWLSTWGDSARLERTITHASTSPPP